METIHFVSTPLTFGGISCTVIEARVLEAALIAEGLPLWFMVAMGSLFHNVFLESCLVDEKLCLNLFGGVKKPYIENKDAGRTADDSGHTQCDHSFVDDGSGDDGNMFGEEQDSDSEENSETDESSGSEQNDDNGEDNEDNDDDSYEDDGSDEDEDGDEDEDVDAGYDTTTSEEGTADEPLLTHARKVYSAESFGVFEHQYKESMGLFVDVTSEDIDDEGWLMFKYKLQKIGDHFRHHKVIALPADGIVECSCNYFSITGILCSHALIVLRCLRIEEIPDHHLLKWQMKSEVSHMGERCFINETRRRRRLSSDDCLYSMSIRASSVNQEAFEDEDYTDDAHVGAPLLRHAKEIYHWNIASAFQEEYRKSEYLITDFVDRVIGNGGIVVECDVFKPGHPDGKRKVLAEPTDGTVKCSCKKFEHAGILCSHALAVLDCLCIVRLPPQYICEEFLKDATVCRVKDIHGPQYCELERFFYFVAMHQTFNKMFNMAAGNKAVQDLVKQGLNELSAKLGDMPKDQLECQCGRPSSVCRNQHSNSPMEKLDLKKAARFYDDQTLKNFVYKEFKRKSDPSSRSYGQSSRRQRF